MKKFLNIVLVFVFTILLVPTFVLAEGEDKKEEVKKAPIQIYEFYGSTCGYCAALNSWFESIEKDYGDYFDLVKYEVWGSEKNNALMNGVAQKMGDAVNGVPYLIVGDYTLNGYSESDNEAILKAILDEYGDYYSKEEVALYIHTYGKLPMNFITKDEARDLGWEGGSVEKACGEGLAIGGDKFGNREGLLPKKNGRQYYECDIDTLGKNSRGAKRIVFSNDGLIYYTGDHYESFTLLYGEE